MNGPVLRTARLTLQPVTDHDHDVLHAVFTQPGVRAFLFDGITIPPDRTSDIIRASRASFSERGLGLWLADSSPGDLVGFGGFLEFRNPPELELLFGLADRYRRQGFGFEIASALVEYGFGPLGMMRIQASTDAGNILSRRLLERLRFVPIRDSVVDGLATVFYERLAAAPPEAATR
ncbi:MAG: GNAT family N-acetyltransferase [Acidobacteriota bacterium]